jgi:hypothetical protein
MVTNEFYKMRLNPDSLWHNMILDEYSNYKKIYKPKAAAVTYLMYSGMSFAGNKPYDNNSYAYFTEEMADSYANAFQVHQKPCKTAYIHKYWIRKLPYIWYLFLVAAPVDIYAHTYQLIYGEHNVFLEGGAFFIPYMVSHWTMLSIALAAPYIQRYFPIVYWSWYFNIIRMNLVIHEYIYLFTLRKLSFFYRLLEFSLFMGTVTMGYNIVTQ